MIVQFGGQTPLNLAAALKANGVNIIGTSPESIEVAEDRRLFAAVLDKLGLRQPANRTALGEGEAAAFAAEIGYPVLLRPSFVLGGRGMFILYSEEDLKAVVRQVFEVMPGKPVLIDKFLEDAIELDVDCLSDGETSVIGGMLEHIEYAGVHSGDAAMVMPPHTLGKEMLAQVRSATHALARELRVLGLMNVQFAIKDGRLYVLEVNPRASRTVPFVAKAIGVPIAKYAAKVMAGMKLSELGFTREMVPKHWCVKEAVFPFVRFPGATIALGPEMRSTGEVMGIDADLGIAFAKAQAAAKPGLPTGGNVFLSVKDADKPRDGEDAGRKRDRGEARREAQRGPPERRRHDQERPDPDGDQHSRRDHTEARREPDPGRGLQPQRLHHDDDHGRAGGGRGDPGAPDQGGRRPPGPGIPGQRQHGLTARFRVYRSAGFCSCHHFTQEEPIAHAHDPRSFRPKGRRYAGSR